MRLISFTSLFDWLWNTTNNFVGFDFGWMPVLFVHLALYHFRTIRGTDLFSSFPFLLLLFAAYIATTAHQHNTTVHTTQRNVPSFISLRRFADLGSFSFSFLFSCVTIIVADIPKAFGWFRSMVYLNTHVLKRCENDSFCAAPGSNLLPQLNFQTSLWISLHSSILVLVILRIFWATRIKAIHRNAAFHTKSLKLNDRK